MVLGWCRDVASDIEADKTWMPCRVAPHQHAFHIIPLSSDLYPREDIEEADRDYAESKAALNR